MKPLPLDNFPGFLISEDGEVYSEFMGGRCSILRETPRRLVGWTDSDGYRHVTLNRLGKAKRFAIHVLTAIAYHGKKPSPTHEVRHLDGIPSNNYYLNLCWGTRKQNSEDRTKHGRSPRGIANVKAKLTADGVREIRALVASGLSKCEVSRRTGISNAQVGKIARRSVGGWPWLDDDEDVAA